MKKCVSSTKWNCSHGVTNNVDYSVITMNYVERNKNVVRLELLTDYRI